ncbi:DciA family protein [Dermatophilaceae bacterium Sec6.4]|nr:DciA family protein [Actinomycetota bacterium]
MTEDATGDLPPEGGQENTEGWSADPIDRIDAARDALARARAGAAQQGFRPGAPLPKRRPKAGDIGRGHFRDGGRDPGLLGAQFDRLLAERGWQLDVAAGTVMGRWREIVGPEVAAHSEPVTYADGVLTVKADSTAWATQLRLLSSTMLGRMEQLVGADVVLELRVTGPGAPSWSHGFRRAPGRGPRDTYG